MYKLKAVLQNNINTFYTQLQLNHQKESVTNQSHSYI